METPPLTNLSDHEIAAWTLFFTILALGVAILALYVAVRAIRRGNKNSSTATLVALYEGFRQAWRRYLGAADERTKQYEFSELLNLFELTCAVHSEHSLVGVSRDLAGSYIRESFQLIEDNEDARSRIARTLTTPRTFEHIRKFLGKSGVAALLQPPTSPIPK